MQDPREKGTDVYVLKVHTGPGMTGPLAAKCEEAGIRILSRGTESIYPRITATTPRKAWDTFLNTLSGHHGTTFGFSYGLATRIPQGQPEKAGALSPVPAEPTQGQIEMPRPTP